MSDISIQFVRGLGGFCHTEPGSLASGARRSSPSVATGTALPVAVPPRPSAARASRASPPGGGGGAFNAMAASPEQLSRRLALLGVSMPPGTLDVHCNRRRGTTTNEVALQVGEAMAKKHDRQARTESERRVTEIDKAKAAGTSFDAMSPDASVDEVRAQLADLGVRDALVLDSFRPHGKALEPPKPPMPTKAQQAAERRDKKLLAEAAMGGRFDAKKLSESGFQKFLRLRFAGGATSWPATRTPQRR